MSLVDTHAHLDADAFDSDRLEMISRAQNAGLTYIVSVGIDLETTYKNIAIAEQYPFVYASCGLHPNHGTDWSSEMETAFQTIVNHPKIVAVGEIGLDFYREHCPHKQQYFVLEKQMHLARQANLPVIFHCRDAHSALLDYYEKYSRQWGPVQGVIHCFSGGPEEAKRYVDYGFYLSFAGPLTYKKNDTLREALKKTPLERILVETDCPYLPPQSKRGLRNEPAYVTYVAEQGSSVLGISLDAFHQAVTENACTLFRLPRRNHI